MALATVLAAVRRHPLAPGLPRVLVQKGAPARGALDRQLQQPPDYDHRVDASGVAWLLRLGVRRLALAFWLLVRDHG
jgi:hypothetical protein